jgi:hypothetical protein
MDLLKMKSKLAKNTFEDIDHILLLKTKIDVKEYRRLIKLNYQRDNYFVVFHFF